MSRCTYIYSYYLSKFLPNSRDIKKLFALEKNITNMLWGSARKVLWKRCSLRKICYKQSRWKYFRKHFWEIVWKIKKNKKNSSKPKNTKKNKKTSRKPKKTKKTKQTKKTKKPRDLGTLGFFVFFCFFCFFLVFSMFFCFCFSRLFWLLWFYRKLRRFSI